MRYFITHVVPKGEEIKAGVSIAACNFSRNLASGDIFDRIYSIPPPGIAKKFDNEDKFVFLHSKIRGWGRFFRHIAVFIEQIKLLMILQNGDSVWFYNLTSLTERLYKLIRTFKQGVRVNIIVLDFTPGTKENKRLLPLINKADGLITLVNSEFFTNKNQRCIPGVVPDNPPSWPLVEIPIIRDFILSGALNEQISQISKILKIFSKYPMIKLHVTGTVEDDSLIERYKDFDNITFHGKVSWDDYLEIMHSCPFILSTRNADAPENKCNFPSKVIEALLHNRIIVSTFKYDQLGEIKHLVIGNSLNEMGDGIINISRMKDSDLIKYANQAHCAVSKFSVCRWRELINLIESKEKTSGY